MPKCTGIRCAKVKFYYLEDIRINEMKKLKKFLVTWLTLFCMILILGAQALLRGSWTLGNCDQTAA
jgi:hypothetical protein